MSTFIGQGVPVGLVKHYDLRGSLQMLANHVGADACAALKSFPRAGMLYAELCENGHDQAIQKFRQSVRMATL